MIKSREPAAELKSDVSRTHARTHATQHTVGNLSVPPSQDVQESVEPISSSSSRSEITQDRTQSLESERNIWSLSAMLTDIVEDVQTYFSLRIRNE